MAGRKAEGACRAGLAAKQRERAEQGWPQSRESVQSMAGRKAEGAVSCSWPAAGPSREPRQRATAPYESSPRNQGLAGAALAKHRAAPPSARPQQAHASKMVHMIQRFVGICTTPRRFDWPQEMNPRQPLFGCSTLNG
jgi:hypothetical protein